MTIHNYLIPLFLTAAAAADGEDPLGLRELAPGVFCMGSSARYGSANMGWVVLDDQVVLIGVPHPNLVNRALVEVEKITRKPVRAAVLTHVRRGEVDAVSILAERHVRIIACAEARRLLLEVAARSGAAEPLARVQVQEFSERLTLQGSGGNIELRSFERSAGPASTALFVRDSGVLFSGELCVNGPRCELAGSDTQRWIEVLDELKELPPRTVVPGFGSIGGGDLLDRQQRYLRELRRQVASLVVESQPLQRIRSQVHIAPEWLVWKPYDSPTAEDIEHVYRELTVPLAPFGGPLSNPPREQPRAMAIIGDRVHDPAYIEAGLRAAFRRAGVAPSFVFDVRALSRENLRHVELLVILRDGAVWPDGHEKPYQMWMTPEQEHAVVHFVETGGGLLALHNATGIYPEGGPYEKLLGGKYNGHGPLERFRVRVTDQKHPITRGVSDYEIADEQHTPIPDHAKVHIILESRSDDGVDAAAGWCYQRGQGRVCYLANGHTRESLVHDMYQLLLQNAMRWCIEGRE
jgi:type 1 glutamine amidotransferase/glyoxylase-like metal-dependent hydrolase (beta-lactamase superfamily II)